MTKTKMKRASSSKKIKRVQVASQATSRRSSRRIVITEDGAFVIRRLSGLDFLMSDTPIVRPQELTAKQKREAELKKATDAKSEVFSDYVKTLITRSPVSEAIFELADATFSLEATEDAIEHRSSKITLDDVATEEFCISVFDLSQSTIETLMTEIQKHSNLLQSAGLGARLDNFRDEHTDD